MIERGKRGSRHESAWVLFALVGALCANLAAAEDVVRYRATPTTEPIEVDGKLDEPAWRDSPALSLAQKEPVPLGPTPYATEVRVLRTDDALYFGFHCVDPEPPKIRVHTWERDGELDEDDRVAILLDTFSDRRTGYWFRFNAVGARQDGLIASPTSSSADWDGLWRGATSRSDGAWDAEIEIPIRSLRFGAGDTWGMNLARYVARERLTQSWSTNSLDTETIDFSRAGRLEGLAGLLQGRGLTIAPYGLTRYEREPGRSATTADAGIDVGYNLTPQLSASLTVNTDFAETEVDAREINLTRFPLFFPEKRPFFLEGSNLFEFGLGLGESFLPFYSRRVGLFGGERLPILGGAKLLGRAGRFSIAALGVATDDGGGVSGTELAASRVTYEATPELRLGLIGTTGDPDGVNTNRLAGADLVWHTARFRGEKNLGFGLWGAQSAGDRALGSPSGWGARIEYPNDRWFGELQVDTFGAALEPALGFLPRAGTRQWNGGLAFAPRPDPAGALGWARQVFFEGFYHRVDSLEGGVETWRLFLAPLNVTTQGGGRLEANWEPQFERLAEPFEVAAGVVVPPGDYRFDRFRLEAFTPTTHAWRVGTSSWFGEFFDGRLTEANLQAVWAPFAARLSLDLSGTTFFGELPAGDFTIRLWQLRAGYSFTPDLVLSSFVQYDSESANFGANTRLRYTIRPGCDLFVVWTRGWLRDVEGGGLHLRPQRDEAIVKLRWTFVR